jgi:hypothetical protein
MRRVGRKRAHGTALLRELKLTSEQNKAGLSASTLYRFLRLRRAQSPRPKRGRDSLSTSIRKNL